MYSATSMVIFFSVLKQELIRALFLYKAVEVTCKINCQKCVRMVKSSNDWKEIEILKLNYSLGFKSLVF